jgi:hypothetical protein
MMAVWFAPEEEVVEVEELEELDKALERVLEVDELLVRLEKDELLLVRLEKAEVRVVVVLEADVPMPDRKYPPTPAMTKTITITMAATVVDIAVLERRTVQDPPGRGPTPGNSRSTIFNSWTGIAPHLIP